MSSASPEDGYEDVSLETLDTRLAEVDHVIVFNNGDELQREFLRKRAVSRIPVIAAGEVTTLTRVQSGAGFPVNPLTVPVILEAAADLLAR